MVLGKSYRYVLCKPPFPSLRGHELDVGSIFAESYTEKFAHGISLIEQAGITPAWNDSSAYSAFASAGLTFPVYHRLGVTLGALDSYLNDPPPGFKKNSFQFTLGATYSFQQSR